MNETFDPREMTRQSRPLVGRETLSHQQRSAKITEITEPLNRTFPTGDLLLLSSRRSTRLLLSNPLRIDFAAR